MLSPELLAKMTREQTCSTSYANPYANASPGIEPVSDHMFILATWPPTVPANKLGDSDTVTAMATSDNDKNIKHEYCMAACHNSERTSVGLKHYQVKAAGFRRVTLDSSFRSEPANVPAKIPILKAV